MIGEETDNVVEEVQRPADDDREDEFHDVLYDEDETAVAPFENMLQSVLVPHVEDDDLGSSDSENEYISLEEHGFQENLAMSVPNLIRDRQRAFLNYLFGRGRLPENENVQPVVGPLAAASTHSYLPVSLPEESIILSLDGAPTAFELPLIPLRGVVLFPGETLPMRVFSPAHLTILEELTMASASDSKRAFIGILNKATRSESVDWEGRVGTIAEVIASQRQGGGFGGSTTEDTAQPELVLMSRGIRRFQIRGVPSMKRGMLWGEVETLQDLEPSGSFYDMLPPTQRLLKRPKYNGYPHYPSSLTLPNWVYMKHDAENLKRQILELLRDLKFEMGVSIEDDLVEFSFVLSRNLPVSDEHRLQLLSCPTVIARLRNIHSLLKHSTQQLCCRRCGAIIAEKSDVFSVPGADGVAGAYVNPHGVIHQTVTLRRAKNLLLDGRPVAEDSWFPGYSWTIAYCACYAHMGWLFSRNTDNYDNGQVLNFWGIRRSELVDRTTFEAPTEVEEEPSEDTEEVEEEEEEEEEDRVIEHVSEGDTGQVD